MGQLQRLKPFLIWGLMVLVLAGLQTTVWPMIVGGVPAPQLWLNLALYFILFRPMFRALLIIYATGFLLVPFSSLPIGIFWLSFLVLVPLGSTVKSRTFWPGVRYFLIGSLLLCLGWEVVSFLMSQIFEKNSTHVMIFTRITECLLTPLAAVPQYHLMHWLDRFNQDEMAPVFHEAAE